MKKVGFDFGTTNSIISYYDDNNQVLSSFKPGAGLADYIPSAVAYRENKGIKEILIGNKAKSYLTNKNYKVFERFKLLLCENEEKLVQYGYDDTTPENVTEDYFKELFNMYKKGQSAELQEIVITVPEIWLKEQRHRTAREKIKEICNKIGLPLKKIISEPQAACAYFCYAYKKDMKKDFLGHVLVVDYGGGTLDISLCEVIQDSKIKVLESSGRGEDNNHLGCAGVAFDQEMASKIYKTTMGVENQQYDDKIYIKTLEEFEKDKIHFTEDIFSKLEQYYMDETLVEDEEIFSIDCNNESSSIYCKDLVDTYNNINRDALKNSLEKIKSFFGQHGVNELDLNKFRVLMVGGFSNFYCVQKTVRDFFNSNIGDADDRFRNCLSTVDKSLAISYGAAVVANSLVDITYTCPYTLGIRLVFLQADYKYVERDVDIIKKGEKIDGILGPIYSKHYLSSYIQKVDSEKSKMIIYIDDRVNKRRYIALDKKLEQLFPNFTTEKNKWHVGFSVDEDIILSFWAKDEYEVKETSLQKLITSLPPLVVCEEE